jgi:hypothetical protein
VTTLPGHKAAVNCTLWLPTKKDALQGALFLGLFGLCFGTQVLSGLEHAEIIGPFLAFYCSLSSILCIYEYEPWVSIVWS